MDTEEEYVKGLSILHDGWFKSLEEMGLMTGVASTMQAAALSMIQAHENWMREVLSLFYKCDADNSGHIEVAELNAVAKEAFMEVDRNHDGKVIMVDFRTDLLQLPSFFCLVCCLAAFHNTGGLVDRCGRVLGCHLQ